MKQDMKALKQKSKQELLQFAKDAKTKLQQMTFDLAAGKLKNVREIHETKKYIAQLLTLCQKENSKES
ncbi:MAG: 50S ribosomal protein L29 [bacterium]|nr:50S ribosomal protein L29 [bacterium]